MRGGGRITYSKARALSYRKWVMSVPGYSRIEDVGRLLSPKGFLITVGGAWAFFGVLGMLEAQTAQGRIGTALGAAMLAAGLFLSARLDRLIVTLIGVVALYVEFLNISAGMLGPPVASTSDHFMQIAIAGPALWIAISGGFGER
jgi:hypothetical protein